ncbi:hypothetical protein [Methanolapillus millepedarum]|uniref:Uncharacterized protein n=1 Tax=Methanolapillus millepedarum TaxID=3028296 RepID=A0AA96V1V2_9EURY|nr:hypothetical protein MsAc7_04260 [Methanosarcinaceae archaeon Ac7]
MLQKENQFQEKGSSKIPGLGPQNLISFEMGNENITLICTYGKISMSLNRQVTDYAIGKILKSISVVDNSTSHEMEILCDFDDIPLYQTMGYTLVAYGRHNGKYRVTFNIPFSSEKALYHLTVSFFKELEKQKTLKKDFYWNGKDNDILKLFYELKDMGNWDVKAVKNKEQ